MDFVFIPTLFKVGLVAVELISLLVIGYFATIVLLNRAGYHEENRTISELITNAIEGPYNQYNNFIGDEVGKGNKYSWKTWRGYYLVVSTKQCWLIISISYIS